MNYVTPSVTLLDLHNAEEKLERCMRICYKSEDKICEGSAARIIKAIVSRGHLSTTEHFRIRILCDGMVEAVVRRYLDETHTSFIRILDIGDDEYSYTLEGNLRAFYEMCHSPNIGIEVKVPILQCLYEVVPSMSQDWKAENLNIDFTCVKYAGESPDYFTVKVVTDRGVLGQFVRHRSLSPSVESTRYCNYLNKGMSFCIPEPFMWAPCGNTDDWVHQVIDYWFNDPDYETKYKDKYVTDDGNILHAGIVKIAELAKCQAVWEQACKNAELSYNSMIGLGATPQEARTVLPFSHKVEFVMTGTYEAWEHFVKLRKEHDADPQIQIIAEGIETFLTIRKRNNEEKEIE